MTNGLGFEEFASNREVSRGPPVKRNQVPFPCTSAQDCLAIPQRWCPGRPGAATLNTNLQETMVTTALSGLRSMWKAGPLVCKALVPG